MLSVREEFKQLNVAMTTCGTFVIQSYVSGLLILERVLLQQFLFFSSMINSFIFLQSRLNKYFQFAIGNVLKNPKSDLRTLFILSLKLFYHYFLCS